MKVSELGIEVGRTMEKERRAEVVGFAGKLHHKERIRAALDAQLRTRESESSLGSDPGGGGEWQESKWQGGEGKNGLKRL